MQHIRFANHKEDLLASFIPFEGKELQRGNLENAVLDLAAMLNESYSEHCSTTPPVLSITEGEEKLAGTVDCTPETLAKRYHTGDVTALAGDSVVTPTRLTYPISDLFRYLKLCECSTTENVKIGRQVINLELVEKYMFSDITYDVNVPLLPLLQACNNTRSKVMNNGGSTTEPSGELSDENAAPIEDEEMVFSDELLYATLMRFYAALDPSFDVIFFPQYYHDLASTDAAVFGLSQFIAMRGSQQQEPAIHLTLDLFCMMNYIYDPLVECLWQCFLSTNRDAANTLATYGYNQRPMFLNLSLSANMEQWFAATAMIDLQEVFTSARLNNLTVDYDTGCALLEATANSAPNPPGLGDLIISVLTVLNMGKDDRNYLLDEWNTFYNQVRADALLNGQRISPSDTGNTKPLAPHDLTVVTDADAKDALLNIVLGEQSSKHLREFGAPTLLRSALIKTVKYDVSDVHEIIITSNDINVLGGDNAGHSGEHMFDRQCDCSDKTSSTASHDNTSPCWWTVDSDANSLASDERAQRFVDVASVRWPLVGREQNNAILAWLDTLNLDVPDGMCPLIHVDSVDAALDVAPRQRSGHPINNEEKYGTSPWLINEELKYALTEDAVRAIAFDVLTHGAARTLDVEARRTCELSFSKYITGVVQYPGSKQMSELNMRCIPTARALGDGEFQVQINVTTNEEISKGSENVANKSKPKSNGNTPDNSSRAGSNARDYSTVKQGTYRGKHVGKPDGIVLPHPGGTLLPHKAVERGNSRTTGSRDNEFGEINSPTWSPKSILHLRTLCAFSTDLTAAAYREDQGRNILCRDTVIDNMVTVLTRREKSNPILLAPAGTGKTAIVEGLAHKIVSGEIPSLMDTRILSLDILAILAKNPSPSTAAGTVKKVISEAAMGNITVFIDEIHLIGRDSHRDSTLANAMKPLLARPGLRVIGATTEKEYNSSIGRDKALQRRFSPMHVPVLTFNEVVEVLDAKRGEYMNYHSVEYAADVSTEIALLASAYLGSRPSPDRELDVMDVSGSYARKRGAHRVTDNDIVAAVKMLSSNRDVHTKQELARNALSDDEAIMNMFPRVAGQRNAKIAVGRTVIAGQLGLTASDRPRAVLLFAGPSGVGKTYLAREMASVMNLNADEDVLIVPLSEFVTEADYTKLIGTGPQWVGYNDGGMLTNFIAAHPSGVVVLDEFDLCDEAVSKLFMGIFDTGRLTNGSGDTIDAKQITFVCTTNVGYTSETMKKKIGFVSAGDGSKYDGEAIRETLRNTFGIAMMSRFSDVVLFDDLSDDEKTEACRVKWNDYAELVDGRFGVKLDDVFPWNEVVEHIHSIIEEIGTDEANVRVLWGLIEREITSRVMGNIASGGNIMETGAVITRNTGDSRYIEKQKVINI